MQKHCRCNGSWRKLYFSVIGLHYLPLARWKKEWKNSEKVAQNFGVGQFSDLFPRRLLKLLEAEADELVNSSREKKKHWRDEVQAELLTLEPFPTPLQDFWNMFDRECISWTQLWGGLVLRGTTLTNIIVFFFHNFPGTRWEKEENIKDTSSSKGEIKTTRNERKPAQRIKFTECLLMFRSVVKLFEKKS